MLNRVLVTLLCSLRSVTAAVVTPTVTPGGADNVVPTIDEQRLSNSMYWDFHVHCFNPTKHPFKPSRSYTPEAAPLSALVDNTIAGSIMIVQASIEDGPDNLIETLAEGREKYPERQFRGTISTDPEPGRGLEELDPCEFTRFHAAGVRSIRIHGSYGGNGDNATWVREQFLRAARLEGVKRYGWSLSSQLPLRMWAELADFLLDDEELANVRIIADHNGSATPEDVGSPAFETFLGLLAAGKVSVKIGALHRRAPDDVHRMQAVVAAYAQHGPGGIVWGSDWPHVNTTSGGETPNPPLLVNTTEELQAIKSWLSAEQWEQMMVVNPAKLIGL